MRRKDIKEPGDLRDMTLNDVVDVLDELRAIAQERGKEWLARGKVEARRAIGAPNESAVTTALLAGVLLGAVGAAIATMLFSPVPAPEARRRLNEQVSRVRERMPMTNGDGHLRDDEVTPSDEVGAAGASGPTTL